MSDDSTIRVKDSTTEISFHWLRFNGDDCFDEFLIEVAQQGTRKSYSFGPCALFGLRRLARFFRDTREASASGGFQNPGKCYYDIIRTPVGFRLSISLDGSSLAQIFDVASPTVEVNDEFLQSLDSNGAGYRTLRGFLASEQADEETYFAYSATLRIFGDIADLDEISRRLQLQPSSMHRKGEMRGPRSVPYKHDMWSYMPVVPEEEPLHKHIDALWTALRPHKEYLLELKRTLTVDVFLGYRSNCDMAGLEVPHTSLEMFSQLEIPFGVSIIVT